MRENNGKIGVKTLNFISYDLGAPDTPPVLNTNIRYIYIVDLDSKYKIYFLYLLMFF